MLIPRARPTGTLVAGEDELKQLDSSIKRNSALTKKLKQLTEDNKQAILDDIRKTNQSKVRPCWGRGGGPPRAPVSRPRRCT